MLSRLILSKALAATIGVFMTGALEAADLKRAAIVYGDIVYARDLFKNAGDLGGEALFLSPDPGRTGRISATRVADEARTIGLYDVNLNGIEIVEVTRPSQIVRRQEVLEALRQAVHDAIPQTIDFEIRTSEIPAETHVDARIENPFSVETMSLSSQSPHFQTSVTFKTYNGTRKIPVRGAIIEMKTVHMASRDIERGAVLSAADLIEERIPAVKVRSGAVSSPDLLIGKAAVRRVSQGRLIREQDVGEPELIQPNDPVMILYAIPGLLLTVQGRALDAGAKDDVIGVMNLQSRRVIRARVNNRGEVIVDPRNPIYAANIASNG
ncbi:MAG: flagellar basal body P-ring formation chaperone FlgA [Pseudomonadota bacterium]